MRPKVLVVSLNPAIDCEWEVERVHWEEKNNILRERRWAGGKGSNVARWLRHLGGFSPELLVPLGGVAGKELAGYLAAAKVRTRIVPLKQDTRVNVIVTARTGGQMRFNPLGPLISRAEWAAIVAELKAQDDPRMFGRGGVFEAYPYADDGLRGFYERYMGGEKLRAGWVNASDFAPAPLDAPASPK